MAYDKLKDPNYPIKKLYLSNIISFLIGYSQRIYHCVPVMKYEDWGSLETWNQLQRNYATYIVDADRVMEETLTDNNVTELADALTDIRKGHMQYIIVTVGRVCPDTIKHLLIKKGINCIGVVPEISHSDRKFFVKNMEELRMASMEVN